MNAAELEALVQPIQGIATVLTQLGVPGLLSLALAGPALIICAMLYFEHLRTLRQEKEREAYHASVNRVLESYREDSRNMLKEVSKEHAEAVRLYASNAELTKDYKRLADSMQTIIVNNTRAMERLTTIIESRGL